MQSMSKIKAGAAVHGQNKIKLKYIQLWVNAAMEKYPVVRWSARISGWVPIFEYFDQDS